MATPQPLPGSVATPPPTPPGTLTPEEAAINFNSPLSQTPSAPPPEPPGMTPDAQGALRFTHPDVDVTAPMPAPPAPPQGMFTTTDVAGPAVGRRDTQTTYELPHVFQTEEDRAIALRRAVETGDFEALTDVARRSGQPNPEKWAADLIAQSKTRGQGVHEGDARALPDGSWVQDLYDNTGRIVGQIPAGPKGAGRQLGTRERDRAQAVRQGGCGPDRHPQPPHAQAAGDGPRRRAATHCRGQAAHGQHDVGCQAVREAKST